jgi:hypothetical protein
VRLKVDTVQRIGSSLVIVGWCSDEGVTFSVEQGQQLLEAITLRVNRPDVNSALGLPENLECGFLTIVDVAPRGEVAFGVLFGDHLHRVLLRHFENATDLHDPSLIPPIAESLRTLPVGSAEWAARAALLGPPSFNSDQLSGYVDHAYMTDAGGVVAGWALGRPDVQIWVEDDSGRAYDLRDAFRWWRQDVDEAGGTLVAAGRKAGFLKALSASHGATSFRLGGCCANGRLFIPETAVIRKKADVRSMGCALFDINTPRFELVERANAVDIPVLAAVNRAERAAQGHEKPIVRAYGNPPVAPLVSIIIPLYERYDMIELQLLEFAKDPDFASECEVIYVNDDPRHFRTTLGPVPRSPRL